jgi:cold shock CspA family protein
MLFRSFITSGLIAMIFVGIIFFSPFLGIKKEIVLHWPYFFVITWSIGLLSIAGFFYGRKIKQTWKKETGTIKWFDPSKGYGFLLRDKGGDLFVHFKSVKEKDRKKLTEDTRVKFSVETKEKGPQAENIEIIK